MGGKTWGLVLAGAIALGAGAWVGKNSLLGGESAQRLEIGGVYIDAPRPLPEFTLQHSSGSSFSRDDFKGQWSFLYFGYTYCPDACPLTLGQLKAMEALLAKDGQSDDNAYLLVSVDPKRDSPERLGQYTEFFGPKFTGATGTTEAIDELTKHFGIYYSVPENPEDPKNYLVDHSSTVILINPNAELQAVLTAPHDPQSMARDLAAIQSRFSL